MLWGYRQYLPEVRQLPTRCLSQWTSAALPVAAKEPRHEYCLMFCIKSPGEVPMVNKLDSAFFLQQQALTLRANRQQVLAGNIANADTPHYQARDFDFATALQKAISGGGEGSLRLAVTAAGHLPGSADSVPVRLMYRQVTQASADGNSVEMDVERAQFAENAIHYEAGMTFLSGKIKTLLAALQA